MKMNLSHNLQVNEHTTLDTFVLSSAFVSKLCVMAWALLGALTRPTLSYSHIADHYAQFQDDIKISLNINNDNHTIFKASL